MLKDDVKRLLIITSSGGGGLLQAAKAKEQQALRKKPNIAIIKKDLLKEWLSKNMGRFCINLWDKAQKKGKVRILELVSGKIGFADILFGPRVFLSMYRLLCREKIDYVIDTQPLCTRAIVKAIRLYNFLHHKDVTVEKVLVDLPTHKADWFFSPIKSLSKKDREIFTFVTVSPLLNEGETAESFWKKHCKLKEADICYQDFYVRESFEKFKNQQLPIGNFHFVSQYHSNEEKQMMEKVLKRGPIQALIQSDGTIEHVIPKDAIVITILLGSQPAFEATVTYVTEMIELARQFPDKPIVIYAFCSRHSEGNETLFAHLCHELDAIGSFPEHISAVPLTYQDEDVIASLFFRSDLTCTRSGGQTCMELMAVMQGEIWIHSEAKITHKDKRTMKKLLRGIPKWEAGNALYLKDRRGAHIVTPKLFQEDFLAFLKDKNLVVDEKVN
jgi:hypothetical protein